MRVEVAVTTTAVPRASDPADFAHRGRKAGDMAYEFSNGEQSFEMKSGKKETLYTSILRVWKKEANEWRVAATFSRAHDTGAAPQQALLGEC